MDPEPAMRCVRCGVEEPTRCAGCGGSARSDNSRVRAGVGSMGSEHQVGIGFGHSIRMGNLRASRVIGCVYQANA
jgi:hypothetical protein